MTSPSRPKRRQTRAVEIAEDLRARIDSGEIAPGSKLLSTKHLATEYTTGEGSVHAAVALLKTSGHVTSRQGKGVFVREFSPLDWHVHRFERGPRRDDQAANADDWKAGVIEQGRTPTQDAPEVSEESAPADIAAWLQLDPEAPVVARRRLRRVDGAPFQIADSWFPQAIADDCPEVYDPADVTRPGGFLAHNGHPQARLRDEIRAWTPTVDEAKRLEVAPGTPVTRHVRIGYGGDVDGGAPIRVMVTIAPGDRNTLVYEMEA